MARTPRTARRARLALAAAVCASVAADRPAAGATMPLTDGGLLECEPPRRLLHTAIEWQSRTYDFAGTCRRIRKDGVAPIYFTIHGQWHPEEKVALEVIEVQAERSAKGQLRLKATCADDPWLTRNPCTLLSFVDQEGRPVPPPLTEPPVPKSAGSLTETAREALRKAAEALPSRPRPVLAAPAEGASLRDVVEVVLERPKGAPAEFPRLFEIRFEWLNPVTKSWVAQPAGGQYAPTCDGRWALPVDRFSNRGRFRLRARFAAPEPAKNPWSEWRGFTIPPGP